MIDFHAQGRCATAVCDNPITTGSVGIAVRFRFSVDWDDLQKVAVFRAGESSVDVVLTDDACTVPPDVLTVPGLPLMIGVYGMSTDGTIVIPTIWARAAIIKAGTIPSGIDPTEPAPSWQAQVQEMASEALEMANAVKNAADAGEFDGSCIWYTTARISSSDPPFVRRRDLIGREGTTVQVHDLLVAPAPGEDGEPTTLYEIASVGTACNLTLLCKLQGEDGYSPAVTIAEITKGHRITITDEAHPQGQSFDVMDGENGDPGADGNYIWWTTYKITSNGVPGYGEIYSNRLKGRSGTPAVKDLVVGPAIGQSGSIEYLYEISSVAGQNCVLKSIGSIKGDPGEPGEDGYSPAVTITEITGGHRITITDEAHPQGQSFDVMDGSGGGGGTFDYNDLSNKPQIGGVTLSGNKSLADLGAAPAGAYVKPSGGIPKTDLAAAVQTSLGKADDALPASGNAYRTASIPMGQLDSTSTATVMTAQVDGITELRDGVCVWLENGVIASASGVTLNINSLGAKPIYNSLSGAIVTTTFTAASTYLFVYNSTRVTGGCWDMVYGYDANTTYTPVKLGFGYATCSTAEATAAKTAALSSYTLTTGGIVAVKFTNAVPAGSTLNINSKGAKVIFYKGAAITAGVIKAGDTVTMIYSTYYHVLSIDRDIPSPSVNTTQEISIIDGYIGNSTDYARADHTHYFDITNAIKKVSALNVPVFLYDGQNGVYIPYGPQILAIPFQSQVKIIFALVVPPVYDNYPVLFTVSKFDTTTGELHLTGITGGVLYEATLLPGADPTGQSSSPVMVGTMTTTNLALPSAQGVSF